jgi:hypothetical protein
MATRSKFGRIAKSVMRRGDDRLLRIELSRNYRRFGYGAAVLSAAAIRCVGAAGREVALLKVVTTISKPGVAVATFITKGTSGNMWWLM